MKLSEIFTPLNETLKANLERPNKKRIYTSRNQNKAPREALELEDKCVPANKKEFDESSTKMYLKGHRAETIIKEALEEKFPNIPFSISKASHSTYTVRTYQLKAEDIGLDPKYNDIIKMFEDVTTFKIKHKKTDFGKHSSYDFDIGSPEEYRMVSALEIGEGEDVEILETILDTIKSRYDAIERRENQKREKEAEFHEALKKHGITMEDLKKINQLKSAAGL